MIFCTDPLQRATFVERPNRFIVFADHQGQRRRTYVANPGKLNEILLPQATQVLLAHKPHTKTKWESVGACWDSRWDNDGQRAVFLNTGRVNDVAEAYLEAGLVPGLEDADIVKREHTVGNSRFDFLLATDDGQLLLEVKSVTLVEQGLAFFPDARSKRATKHVEELTELAEQGTAAAVLFIVQGQADQFLPDLHNDLDFAKALRQASRHLPIYAIGVSPTLDDDDRLVFPDKPTKLSIPWQQLDPHLADSGLYLAVLQVDEPATVKIGALGTFDFEPGFYTYVGSAQKGLTKRMNRHKRTRKRTHWHIDYLRNAATRATTYPIRGATDESALANELAAAMSDEGRRFPKNFGATDCDDAGHLIFTPTDPVSTPNFQRLLTTWRVDALLK